MPVHQESAPQLQQRPMTHRQPSQLHSDPELAPEQAYHWSVEPESKQESVGAERRLDLTSMRDRVSTLLDTAAAAARVEPDPYELYFVCPVLIQTLVHHHADHPSILDLEAVQIAAAASRAFQDRHRSY